MRSKIVAYQKFVVTLQGICWSYPLKGIVWQFCVATFE